MAENRVIGRDNTLPWHLPDDLKRFKALTMGHALIMGRRTFESIGRPLPGRRSIVVSRNPRLALPDGVDRVPDLAAAFALVGDRDAFVAGGGELYRAALPAAERIHMTRVHALVEGETTFPELDPTAWRVTDLESHPADERHAYAFSFHRYDRMTSDAISSV
jgi:dihydrofolate reductase